jgi:cellobiose transport system substrate-binding protein
MFTPGRLLSATTAFLIPVGALFACTGQDQPQPYTLVVQAWREDGVDPLRLNELVEQFEAVTPGVTVEVVHDQGQVAHHEAVGSHLAAGGYWADVVAVEVRTLTDTLLVAPQLWVDLNGYLPGTEDDYAASRWSASLTPEGRQLGLPTDLPSVAVCYRRDLLEAADLPADREELASRWRTWDEFIEFGLDYRERVGRPLVESARTWFESIAQSAGDPSFVDESGELVVQTNPALRSAWDTAVRMIEAGITANAPQWTDGWFQGMRDGRFAAMICPSWMLPVVPDRAPGMAARWDIAPLPADAASAWGGTWLSVPATTEHPAQAAALAAFLTNAASSTAAADALAASGDGYLLPANLEAIHGAQVSDDVHPYFHDAPVGRIYTEHADDPDELHLGPWYSIALEAISAALGRVEDGTVGPAAAWRDALMQIVASSGLSLPLPLPDPQAALPVDVHGFTGEICGPSQSFAGYEGAASYEGPGPHPITFALATEGSITWPDLPASWQTENPALVQLLACVVGIERGAQIRTCSYQPTGGGSSFTVRLYHASYTLEVRETATGALLRTVELAAADTSCPFFVSVSSNDPTINATMSTNQLRQAIGDLVVG